MRLIGVNILNNYKLKHANLAPRLDAWVQEVKEASWKTTHDLKDRYRAADFLKGNHVVINIKGNKYRLLFQVNYNLGIVLVKRIGTHAEYNKWKLE